MVHHHHGRRLLNINSSTILLLRSRGFSSRPQRDFFADLRLRVAKALTDSLHPDDVRRELLGVSGQPQQQQQQAQAQGAAAAATAVQKIKVAEEPASSATSSSLSIAETIAAVREEESRKFAAKWEREKDIIMAEAERAVRARLESDLVLKQRQMAFEKWKQGVESEKTKPSEVVVVEIPATAASNTEQKQQREEEEEGAIDEQQQEEDFAALSTHPILGPCIADLGYKRLHLISIEKLIHIPVWEKQRIYRHDRAVQMAKDKRKTLHLGLPGVMGIHENTVSGELRILDGQHRIGMLAILLMLEGSKKQQHQQHGEEEKSNTASDGSTVSPLKDKPIVVEVYPSAEPQSAKELFTEINRAEPVKLVDMPGVLKDSSRHILNEAAGQLRDLYPEMFKPSQRCRPPHLNIDNLREALFVASVLDRHQVKNATALLDWMRAENEKLRLEYQKENVRSKVPEKVMEKADANQFYLGLESTWYTK